MKIKSKEQGFTLIELLLVVVIIGVLLAVIVPRAWRANVDAKYGLLRQTASELGSFATQWAQQQSEAAQSGDSATDNAYFTSLLGNFSGATVPTDDYVRWIARPEDETNWHGDTTVAVIGRSTIPNATVNDIIPVGTNLANPFNNANIFSSANLPGGTSGTPAGGQPPVPGALALGRVADDGRNYYAFVFLGEDSEDGGTFHAGQGDVGTIQGGGDSGIAALRNGVFMARTGTL